jgi:ferric-chelate reductase
LSVPRIIRAICTGRGPYDFRNWIGIKEHDQATRDYDFIVDTGDSASPERSWAPWTVSRYLDNVAGILSAFFCLTIPKVGLNVGQSQFQTYFRERLIQPIAVILLVGYTATVLLCVVRDAKLIENPNRPGTSIFIPHYDNSNTGCSGFLTLAQLPVVFLFSTKNSILSFLLGPGVGYEKLNFLHRWSGRLLFLTGVLHGSLWIRSQYENEMPILGEPKATTGIVAFSFLCLIFIVSLRPGRIFVYQAFVSLQWVLFLSPRSIQTSLLVSQSCLCRRLLCRHFLPYPLCRPMDLHSPSDIWAGYSSANVKVSIQRRCSCSSR